MNWFGTRRAQNSLLLAVTMLLGFNLVFSGPGPRQAEAQVSGGGNTDRPKGVRDVTETSTTGINPGAQRAQMLRSLKAIESRLSSIESKVGGELQVRVVNPGTKDN